jgi:hypothetical protein
MPTTGRPARSTRWVPIATTPCSLSSWLSPRCVAVDVAVAASLHERDGDPATAARLYADAARGAPNLAERDHLTRQAARLNAGQRD